MTSLSYSETSFTTPRRKKPKNGGLAKMASFHLSKRSDHRQCTLEVRCDIFIENLTVFLLSKSGRNYSNIN